MISINQSKTPEPISNSTREMTNCHMYCFLRETWLKSRGYLVCLPYYHPSSRINSSIINCLFKQVFSEQEIEQPKIEVARIELDILEEGSLILQTQPPRRQKQYASCIGQYPGERGSFVVLRLTSELKELCRYSLRSLALQKKRWVVFIC